jgi:hypothetical protein
MGVRGGIATIILGMQGACQSQNREDRKIEMLPMKEAGKLLIMQFWRNQGDGPADDNRWNIFDSS